MSVLADLPATHVGILSYLEPVVVVLAAWAWLGQRPGGVTVVGGLLVVAAGVGLAARAAKANSDSDSDSDSAPVAVGPGSRPGHGPAPGSRPGHGPAPGSRPGHGPGASARSR